jgi:hypothetical protein
LKHISITPPSFMKFCPVVPEICRGQVHSAWKERRITRTRTRITRYDYNLTIMKSPKPATDTIYPHFKFWWYRTMLNFYPPIFMPCFGSHFENSRHLENFQVSHRIL